MVEQQGHHVEKAKQSEIYMYKLRTHNIIMLTFKYMTESYIDYTVKHNNRLIT